MSVETPRDDRLYRAKIERICLGRTLMPDEDIFERTVGTTLLFVVWAAIVLGPMYTNADPPRYESSIGTTIIVRTVIGKMWDFESELLIARSRSLTAGVQQRTQRTTEHDRESH
ncbi:hypothetical protein NJ7G_3311 [Natrinema sp. J7-2]|nr:hypothetical protein NJ7G_3311 [Natrinema sp. J7-2]